MKPAARRAGWGALLTLALSGCMGTEPDKPKPRLEALSAPGGDFAQTRIGTRKVLEFALRNSDAGFKSVETLKDIAISVSGSAVSLSHTCPTSLEEGESCLISVIFQPTDVGTMSGQLRVASSNAEEGTIAVGLAGSSVTALDPAQGAVVFSGDTSTDFSVSVGKSVKKTYTVRNVGNATDTLTISGPGADDIGWSFTHNCGETLAADATCTLDVTFSSTARGTSVPTAVVVEDAYNKDYGRLRLQPVGIAQ
ncbi:MAG: choice-of-anchor D domain-containing protein [Piscinibacter sp.]|nr:choice-of-anchor D domain-containing protein [Piscinibacter sp.]